MSRGAQALPVPLPPALPAQPRRPAKPCALPSLPCAVLLTLRELLKKYPQQALPMLDPVADLGIREEKV